MLLSRCANKCLVRGKRTSDRGEEGCLLELLLGMRCCGGFSKLYATQWMQDCS